MCASNVRRQTILFASFVVLGLLSSPSLGERSSIDRIVTFGTSLSDTGNAFIWLSEPENQGCGTPSNVPPYDALDELLVPDGPYAKGGHHFTNGATWVEGMARYLALAGNTRPALQHAAREASNYAVGGARAAADYPCRYNLAAQISAYLTDFPETSASTLVVVEIGSNDVRDALVAAAGGQDPTPYLQNALAGVTASIIALYGHGARKFLVLNVPDVGKTPAVHTLDQSFPGIASLADALSIAYNGGLALVVAGLDGLPGIDLRILDIYATLNDVVATPANYGFVDVTDACITPDRPPFECAKPDTYVFWDGIHPTQAMHAIVAQRAISAISAP